jgi:ketosteroid isomerase-like protein
MDRSDVEHWLDGYLHAWKSDDPQDIAALFTEDITYSPHPWPRESNRWVGRDTVVRNWIERGDSKFGWRFEHELLAVEGDAAVIEGWTYYDPRPDDPRPDAYANVWLVRFAADGRAREFVEWWVQEPREES